MAVLGHHTQRCNGGVFSSAGSSDLPKLIRLGYTFSSCLVHVHDNYIGFVAERNLNNTFPKMLFNTSLILRSNFRDI